jgi:hypothetical protein
MILKSGEAPQVLELASCREGSAGVAALGKAVGTARVVDVVDGVVHRPAIAGVVEGNKTLDAPPFFEPACSLRPSTQ